MGKNAGTILGSVLTLTGVGAPIGIGLIAADQSMGGNLLALPEAPTPPKDVSGKVNQEAALANDAERRRKSQTATSRAGSVAEALSATTAKTVLGGTK